MVDDQTLWAYPRPFRDALYDAGAGRGSEGLCLLPYIGRIDAFDVPKEHKVPRTAAMPSAEALDMLRREYEGNGGQRWGEAITLVLTELAKRGYVS